MFDDELTEAMLEEKVTAGADPRRHPQGDHRLKMTPVMMGSAYKNKGVQLLLDGVTLLPARPDRGREQRLRPRQERRGASSSLLDPTKPLVSLAFKLEDGRTASSPTSASTRASSRRATRSPTPAPARR
jgi:elongation factor G